MLFSDDDDSNFDVDGKRRDSKIESVELAMARRHLLEKEKVVKKTRDEIKALYRINRRLNLKCDRLKVPGKYVKDSLKRSKGKKVVQDSSLHSYQSDSEDIESGDSELEFNQKKVNKLKKTKSNAGQQYVKYPLERSKGKKVVQDSSPHSYQSDSEDIESGDSELEFNPKPVKKPKKTKSNAGKQFITSMNSNVHSEQSNSEDYNSETEQSDIGECISLSEQICESSHPLVQEDDLEDNAANSKYKFFVL